MSSLTSSLRPKEMVSLSLGSCFISRSIRLPEYVAAQRDRKLRPPQRPARPCAREGTIPNPLFDSAVVGTHLELSSVCSPSTSSPCLKRARDGRPIDNGTQIPFKRRRLHPCTEPLVGQRAQTDMETTTWRPQTLERTPDLVYTSEELVNEHGMGLFAWDGRTSHLLLDQGGSIIGVLAGRPIGHHDWDSNCEEAFEAIRSAMMQANPGGPEQVTDLSHGIFLREACQVPLTLSWPPHMGIVLESLQGHRSIQRICKFASCVFEMFCKASHSHMRSAVEVIRTRDDYLRQYDDSALGVFPCRTFNSGVRTERPSLLPSRKIRDHSRSWTSITALGRFDPRSGGHIVLWDLNLIVEFPPGSTVLIPSTLLRYSYTSIQPADVRCSVEQFATPGIFNAIEGEWSERSLRSRFTRFNDLLGDKVMLSW